MITQFNQRSEEDNICCSQLGGVVQLDPSDPSGAFDLCQNAMIGGSPQSIYNAEACFYLSEYGPVQSESSNSNWWANVSNFDFGIFSNAYCNLYPLLNSGNLPPACTVPIAGGQNSNISGEGSEGQIKKIILVVALVLAVGAIAFVVIRKIKK
jgi:hypothetical protein